MVIPGYEVIQELSRQDWCVLVRARRLADHRLALLKLARRDSPSLAEMEMLKREAALLAELSLTGVPRVEELLRYDERCCLVLEDRGGVPLERLLASRPLDLKRFFKLAIQLTTILSELHQREIIHQNINPRSVLLDPTTGEVCLADFHLASRSAGETQASLPPHLLRSALEYVSPEQTGRMNRAIDYRTDFYSLGATFHEMLTGEPPFRSEDALEVIHWHNARIPPSLAEINPAIPQAVSDIVMKLLAKTAEERYQSSLGLREDLEVCAREWAAKGRITPFMLGQHDVSGRFLISQKLYGRDREVEELLAAFDRVCLGRSATAPMMLVAGYSGIGKTSLIHELYKPIARQKGYFISGKFDQVARNLPFGALIQAFRALTAQLLTESEERLAQWRAKLIFALGVNGGVLAEVIPEIELVIGKQPKPPELGPTEALNRFQLVIQNFVAAIAQPEHPLVVFLDDLQWADPATLSLLQPLLTSGEIRSLFLMGAYRDNEIDAGHLLTRTLSTLAAAGVELRRIALGPLQLADLTLLIRDTLQGELADAEPLAHLVLKKTGGNPFFVNQFLKTLAEDGFLTFDRGQARWTYQIAAIANAPFTDNVIDLMTRKIQRLSEKGQRALTLAACIGNTFDERTLAIVSEQAMDAAGDDLKEALSEGLIVDHGVTTEALPQPEDNSQSAFSIGGNPQSYAFLHDRVQQAAYELIPEQWKQPVHLAVGRLLLEHAQGELSEKKLFDIVHHLNLASGLIVDESERIDLARLNLSAGQKAKSSTAYAAALDHLKAGLALLTETHWQSDFDLVFALHLETAECQYLCGHFEETEEQFALLLSRAATSLERAKVYRLRMVQYENQVRYADALDSAREGLALFGVIFPNDQPEKEAALEREIETIQTLLAGRAIESLIDLPVMTDPAIRMVMNILTDIWSSTYILGDAILARLISATMVRLSLEHGNAEESAYGYVTHAITVGPVREDYKAAYEFGLLALRVNENFHDARRRAKIHQQFHAHVNLWRRPIQTCIPYAREACRSGLESGDFLYAAYGASTEAWPAMVSTQDLAQFVRDLTPNLALIKKLKIPSFADSMHLLINWARALEGKTRARLSLSDQEFDEQEYVERYRGNPFFTMFHAVARLQLCYLLGEYREALEISRSACLIAHHLSGTMWPVVFDFWNGLTLAANYSEVFEDERDACLAEITEAQTSLAKLAENCPENFLCHSLLLAAEIERITNRQLTALDFYERAIRYADETGNVQHQALANELYARFWFSREQNQIAAVFLAKAEAAYNRWGAIAKLKELEGRYASLLNQQTDERAAAVAGVPVANTGSLDLVSVMKAAQAIASEIELEKLLGKLIHIVVENVGAERGILLLERESKLLVYAEETLESVVVKMRDAVPLHQTQGLPTSIVNYVWRSSESVVLADARKDDRYGNDPYVARCQLRSVMCLPVLNQARLIGVLYLENNVASGVFTPDRIQVMQLLSAQAAVSLENALLYDEMKQEAAQRRQAEGILRSIVEGTAAVTGGDFFASLVRHLANALNVSYAFITECRGDKKTNARTLAFWMGDKLSDNVEYDISQTPCLKVLEGEICHYPKGIQELFPNDHDLVTLKAEGYLGIPLCNASGAVIGHLAVLDEKPMTETMHNLPLLKIFAARAGAELERLHAEEELQAAMAEVERLKNRLHAENLYLQEEIRQEHNFEEIVGSSPVLMEVLRRIEIVAPTDSTVLILGETGTGKELIARAIHNRSARKDRPLVKVNCGAISAGLVESELFGHVKGAFTGAFDRRTGRFELANGGTLFLDEVGELPLETQVKLLRVLQEGEFEPVGSSKTLRVDVRIIAATNRDLEEAVRAGRFRADLFYRLNVLPLQVPSLRERRSDIPQLVMFFASRFAKKFNKKVDGVSQETMELLVNYPWPGNIRELQNILERGVVLAENPILSLSQNLFPSSPQGDVRAKADAPIAILLATQAASGPVSPSSASLEEIERGHILSVLEQSRWVIEGPQGAAKILNLHPNTLRGRMKKLGIQRPRASSV